MARDIRVVVWGLGHMGSGIVKVLSERKGVAVAGGVCSRADKGGLDVGDLVGLGAPLGVVAMCDGEFAIRLANPDVVVLAQASTVADSIVPIETALKYGADVVAIAEEMSYPWLHAPELADQIDEMARDAGRTVVGTGVNPGFVLDTLIVALTGACVSIDTVKATRINDLSPYGPTVMASQGVGLTPEQFEAGVASGEVVGHVGFGESIAMVADALGWKLTAINETREPIIATVRRETEHVVVEPGMVAGCRQRGWGLVGEKAVIELDHPQQIRPDAEGIATSDTIEIEGDPPVSLTIDPEIAGGRATIALACNSIPLVMKAPPGLVAMTDLAVPRGVAADMRLLLKKSRVRGRVGGRPADGGADDTGADGADGTGAGGAEAGVDAGATGRDEADD